ncbi:hypothetical protein G6F57_020374 [Rhizopus arrhizus]|nr:hypothetical protein G6F57_020374 [Rhizopus arrhizus]
MQVALHQRPLQQAGVGGDTAEIPVAAIHQHVHKPLDGAEHQQRGHDAGNAYLQHHQRGGNAGQRAAEELKLFDVVRRGPAAHHVQQARIESQLEAESLRSRRVEVISSSGRSSLAGVRDALPARGAGLAAVAGPAPPGTRWGGGGTTRPAVCVWPWD